MRALDVKVLRDAARMRSQLVAIALVMACGVGLYVGMRATMRSLEVSRTRYYAHERFGDAFVSLKRAPEHVARRLREIPGVQAVQTRVVAEVTLDVPGMMEAAIGRLVSIPDRGRPLVNDVRLRHGRMPLPGHRREVLVSEAFRDAHDLRLGAELGAVINGKHERLRVVGTALSPEFIYSVAPGSLFPDDRRFGIVWMRREALATAFDMDGAFNDASLRLARDARVDAVLERADRILDRYGGLGAIARKDQISAFFIDNELTQLRTFALMVPVLFLAVTAFLLNVVVGRIVATQRGQIGVLKAFGYANRDVGRHYAKLVGVVLAVGCVLGLGLAVWLGSTMTRLYVSVYRFPELPLELGAREVIEGVGLSAVAAAAGTWAAIRRSVTLPPAEAMRPPAPAAYRPTVIERLGLSAWLPTAARMVLREIERRPLRAALSVAGIAAATALTIFNMFTLDSVRHMLNVQFGLAQHEDVQLTLFEPRATGALAELEHLPGVLHAEPYRTVPVRLRAGPRVRTGAITGIPRGATLTTLLDAELRPVRLPPDGLVLSRKLAELLDVGHGATVRVEVLEGDRSVRDVRVARIVETFIGTTAHMELAALSRLLHEPASLTGSWLTVDDARLPELHAEVKRTPVIAGVTSRDTVLDAARTMLDENLGTWITISLGFSLVMALGVLYNTVRITLAERARDLASMRVLGFTGEEVGAILLGEMAVLVALATPLGLALGRLLAGVLVRSPGFDTEQFRLPLVIAPATYALAVGSILAATAVSGWSALRRLRRMDLTEVLKSAE